jgi:hypothetical protein
LGAVPAGTLAPVIVRCPQEMLVAVPIDTLAPAIWRCRQEM